MTKQYNKTIKLKDLYPYDTLSQDSGWDMVEKNYKEQFGDEEVLVDFDNVTVINPWKMQGFKHLLKNTNINIIMTNNEVTVNNIRIVCIMEGLSDDRVFNRVVELPKTETAKAIKARQQSEMLKECFEQTDEIDEETGSKIVNILIQKKYQQINNIGTIEYLRLAIKSYSEENNILCFKVICGSMDMMPSVLEGFADLQIDMNRLYGVDVEVISSREDLMNRLGLYLHKKMNDNYTEEDRLKELKKIKPNTPGILIKYKKSRAVDDFGRHGKGEVASSRIAMFKGIVREYGQIYAVFHSYNKKYFYTNEHWKLEHDGDTLTNSLVAPLEVKVALKDIGLYSKFIGSQYHFLMPIQNDKSESVAMYNINETGSTERKMYTIPERMKKVFDDWRVAYDRESLESYIELTDKHLKEKENN